MRNINRLAKRAFTLVELMIVVAIIGVLAALAIYGVRKYLLNAKTAEAKEGIGRIAKDASSAYDREKLGSTVLTLKDSTAIAHSLCAATANKVPSDKTSIAGKKYQSDPSEWSTGGADTGWQCLKFTMKDPQYFMYGYAGPTIANAGTVGTSFTATAEGDLNGDTRTSQFALLGKIQSGGSGESVLTVAPSVSESAPEE